MAAERYREKKEEKKRTAREQIGILQPLHDRRQFAPCSIYLAGRYSTNSVTNFPGPSEWAEILSRARLTIKAMSGAYQIVE